MKEWSPRMRNRPSVWHQSDRFLPASFRLAKKARPRSPHWFGGPGEYQGAKCRWCSQRLTLLWDLSLPAREFDLRDWALPNEIRKRMAPASRLPLFLCLRCAVSAYRLHGANGIRAFKDWSNVLDEDASPFRKIPRVFPRRRISFEKVPSTIEGLLVLEEKVTLENLDGPSRKLLTSFYGSRRLRTGMASQLGGEPRTWQGRQTHVCPNPRCGASDGDFVVRHPTFAMKELAMIGMDADSELANAWSQVAFFVCSVCCAIRGQYYIT